MAEEEPGLDPLPEDARLSSLDERLRRAETKEAVRTGKSRDASRPEQAKGTKLLYDLVGIPLGSGIIGFVFDRVLGTLPWVTLGMLFVGFGLALRSALRSSK